VNSNRVGKPVAAGPLAAEPPRENRWFIELECPEPAALDLEWNYTDRAERVYRAGHRCLARGHFAEALALFQRAAHYDATHYAAYVGQCEALVLLGRIEEAARAADEAMSRYGRNCDLGAARGHVLLHQNDAAQALEFTEIATQNDPGSAYAWIIAGEAQIASRGALPHVMHCFARSRACEDPWPHQEVRIALAYLEWGDAAYAVGSLEAVVAAEPDSPLAWKLLGDSYRREGRILRARASYRRAAELAPQFESARRALSWPAEIAALGRRLREAFDPRRFAR
jgi:tetratricopeptide (TPR) repeat protein